MSIWKTAIYNISPYSSNCMKSDNPNSGIYEADTSRTLDLNGGNPACNQGGTMIVEDMGGGTPVNSVCYGIDQQGGKSGANYTCDVAPTLASDSHGTPHAVYDPSVHHGYKEFADVSETVRSRYGTGGNNQPLVVATMQGFGDYVESDVASSCKQRDYKDATDLVCRMDEPTIFGHSSFGNYKEGIGSSQAAGGDNGGESENLVTAQSTQHNDMQDKCQYVRRLTPLECERLQGYPDGWTAIPVASDSSRYKALGNSIALPFWEHLAHRFVEIGEVRTVGSLFDGISGFPLVFKRAGAVTEWTSEIDPFCQKVTEYHLAKGDL